MDVRDLTLYQERPRVDEPKSEVSDSAASKNCCVAMALPLDLSTGTSENERLIVSKKVPPGGYVSVADMVMMRMWIVEWDS